MSTLLLRISGWFLLFGGLLMAVTNFHLPISSVAAALINLLGGVLLLLGLPALYARQATQIRWIGLVGLIIIWLDVLIFPVLQGGIGGLVPALTPPDFLYIIGPLTIIGTLLFGIMTIRAHVFPRWLGFCLFVGYILGVIGMIFLDKSAPFIAVWVTVGMCLLVLISTSLPAAYAHLQTPCHNPTCDVGQITVDNVIALHRLGLPVAVYALYPLLASLLTGGILFLVSFVIFWRRSDRWFPFFVSLWLLVCAAVVGIGPTSPLVPAQVIRGIANVLTMLVFCALGIFCATFPNGRLAPRWSWLIPLLWVLQLLAFFAPQPFNITNWPGPLFPLEVLLVYASTLALQIYRYVRLYDTVERQQTKWLVYGLAIAERLVLSPKTIRNYISEIYSKLQVTDRIQAVLLAREAGLS